jgi:hypothetical protein
MNITINDHRKIYAVQEEFRSKFPYLSLEFNAKSPREGAAHSDKVVKSSKTLGECRSIHRKGHLTITPHMTVYDLMQVFSDEYGLRVNVLRKSGSFWLNTSETSGWTLEQQNNQGEVLYDALKKS